ncbi:hypothetical protein MES4922_610012 [Mesorhizobium ventifaucium]|uniref:Uncharacterized protein n=1 Tax=Mesorhizobium ventifaucium TaxID=666020 RepID=A0ABM9EDB0_9HYPH|nr:hypothetical protein MES4922_610012 [Mesorhizobium ventifaucium]
MAPTRGAARRLLTYVQEQGLIVCQLDGVGRRTVTLVELAWATRRGIPVLRRWSRGVWLCEARDEPVWARRCRTAGSCWLTKCSHWVRRGH